MRFFLAKPVSHKPFIQWDGIANSIEQLAELEEFENPLVLAENLLPTIQFGVYPLKIVGGELVERDEAEMATFETEYLQRIAVVEAANKIKQVNDGSFTYAGNEYPMNETARLRYMSVQFDQSKNADIMKTNGVIQTIAAANLHAFLEAFHKKVNELTSYIAVE